MRKIFQCIVLAVALSSLFIACDKKQENNPIPAMQRYDDPFERFSAMYPGTWVPQQDAKRATFYTSEEVKSRFLDPYSPGPLGALIRIEVGAQDSLADVSHAVQAARQGLEGATLEPDQNIMFSERPAVMFAYSYRVDESTRLSGYTVLAVADSSLYTFTAEGFNDHFSANKAIIDSTFRSTRLMAKKTAASFSSAPSSTMSSFTSEQFDIDYPDNFESRIPTKGKDVVAAAEFKGYRADSNIRVEVVPAKKNTLEKIVETYKASYDKGGYRVKRAAQTTIGGENFSYIDLAAKKYDVDARAYLTVKNDKVYHVFMTWYRPEANVYVPVFENSIKTLKLKG